MYYVYSTHVQFGGKSTKFIVIYILTFDDVMIIFEIEPSHKNRPKL